MRLELVFIYFFLYRRYIWRFEACLSRKCFPDAPAREKLNTYELRRQSDWSHFILQHHTLLPQRFASLTDTPPTTFIYYEQNETVSRPDAILPLKSFDKMLNCHWMHCHYLKKWRTPFTRIFIVMTRLVRHFHLSCVLYPTMNYVSVIKWKLHELIFICGR